MTLRNPQTAGFSLASIELRDDPDAVFLTRRIRMCGAEFGLDAREVGSLSAATYDLVRHLGTYPGAEGEIRLSDGPSLQVVFRVRGGQGQSLTQIRTRLSRTVRPLRPMVDDIQIEAKDPILSVCLKILLPSAMEAVPVPALPDQLPTFGERQEDVVDSDELRRRYADLAHAFRELQLELQETNRGVIALYADLEAQAEKLREAEDRLRLLLDSVYDYAICMLTPQGDIASWNAGAERLFGYGAAEIIGRNFAVFYQPGECAVGVPAEHLRLAGELGRLASEGVRVRQDTAFDAHVVLTAVRRGRELRGFSLVVRDITERKRMEEDLRRRAEELAAANRAKEDFLATLSHELRTPLNAMLGWTRLMRTGKLDESARSRALETIERNARIQEQLIADILDVSRIVTGKLRLALRPVELAPIVGAALDAVRPAAEAKGLRLVGQIDFAGIVLGDPDRLQQVVWNLLVNGIKFTPPGGEVVVDIERSGPSAAITVSDTGEGISPDLLPFIFDRFTQGDASVTRPHGGLGLGLSIVRHIVELHGGTVHVHSDGSGRGATFTVRLPLRPLAVVAETPGRERDNDRLDV